MPPTVHRILTDGGFEVTVHDFGGPKHSALLLLPANGFHGLCYEPMVRGPDDHALDAARLCKGLSV